MKKVHPDNGGRKEDQQKLQDAKVEWESAVANAPRLDDQVHRTQSKKMLQQKVP